jgi:hypothetical protein
MPKHVDPVPSFGGYTARAGQVPAVPHCHPTWETAHSNVHLKWWTCSCCGLRTRQVKTLMMAEPYWYIDLPPCLATEGGPKTGAKMAPAGQAKGGYSKPAEGPAPAMPGDRGPQARAKAAMPPTMPTPPPGWPGPSANASGPPPHPESPRWKMVQTWSLQLYHQMVAADKTGGCRQLQCQRRQCHRRPRRPQHRASELWTRARLRVPRKMQYPR